MKSQITHQAPDTPNETRAGGNSRLVENLGDFELFVDSTDALSNTKDWVVPIRLLPAMMQGRHVEINGSVSELLMRRLDRTQDIYCSWIPGAAKVPVSVQGTHQRAAQNSNISLFFSCGVDSFYSLLKQSDEINSLILVHGFDVFLDDNDTFEEILRTVKEVAGIFKKKLIIVRTNLRQWSGCCEWGMYHGPAMAAVAHALSPTHFKVYIASTKSYADLRVWGSHPVLDPLWSTEAVRIVPNGAEVDRVGKIELIAHYPEVVQRLRVCWVNTGAYNCGECEKCIRTMIPLAAFGVLDKARFASRLNATLIRRVVPNDDTVGHWQRFATLDLPESLRSAVNHVIQNYTWRLPPHGSLRRELSRCKRVAQQAGLLARAFLS